MAPRLAPGRYPTYDHFLTSPPSLGQKKKTLLRIHFTHSCPASGVCLAFPSLPALRPVPGPSRQPAWSRAEVSSSCTRRLSREWLALWARLAGCPPWPRELPHPPSPAVGVIRRFDRRRVNRSPCHPQLQQACYITAHTPGCLPPIQTRWTTPRPQPRPQPGQ